MKQAGIDWAGVHHCWNCGHTEFASRRTAKGRLWEVLALFMSFFNAYTPGTSQKLKCENCGKYSDVSNPVPMWRPGEKPPPPQSSTADWRPYDKPPTHPDPEWRPDPSGRHELRYWDGAAWTVHVSDSSVTSTDPVP